MGDKWFFVADIKKRSKLMHHLRKNRCMGLSIFVTVNTMPKEFFNFFDTLLGELAKNALNQLLLDFLLLYIFHPQFFSALVFCRLSFHLLMLLENYF